MLLEAVLTSLCSLTKCPRLWARVKGSPGCWAPSGKLLPKQFSLHVDKHHWASRTPFQAPSLGPLAPRLQAPL